MHEAKTDCRPEDVGYNPKTIETLDELARELIDKGLIQSACYLMARHGKVFAHKSAGRLTRAPDSPDFLPEEKRGRTGSVEKWNDEQIKATRDKEDILSLLGGGAAFSTVGDMFKFGRMLLAGGSYNGRRIVGRKWVEAGVRAHIRNKISYNWQGNMFAGDKLVSYGLGLEIDKHEFMSPGTFDHEGAGGVFLFMDPKEDFLFAGFFASPDWHGESWVSPLAVAWSGIE